MAKTFEDKVLDFVKSSYGATNATIRKTLFPEDDTKDAYNPAVDRALQKLSKMGRIKYVGRMWVAGELKICPKCKGKGMVDA